MRSCSECQAEAPAAGRRRALLICHAKTRAARHSMEAAAAVLAEGGVELTQLAWPGHEAMPAAIRRHAKEVDMVVLGGGDGTMNAAASALLATQLPLGILPMGTANDLARTLGIPPDPEAAARIILAGERRRIDLGEVNGRPFFNVASIGLSVAITRELTTDLKRRWGRLAYALASLRALPRARPFHAELRYGERVEVVRTLQIAVGNGRYYGAGMVVAEHAEPDDGLLHLYSLEFERAWWLAALFPALRSGTQRRWRQVRAADCAEVELRTRRARRVDADGELLTTTPARFRVLPGALEVFVPPGTQAKEAGG
ncbi:lipid kinase [Falsiroseomonas bella]|uniref:Lipid kinase n=1 Tax=Falsiroseomonas bella TaxID=2184016 RepID=A0A317FGJ2_9PROT|nr:lipid kinase [Falsiroseomonas bella]PWS37069.1 lipid kinase [Falsiroseomonas bella]